MFPKDYESSCRGHGLGVNFATLDGSVRFILDSIEKPLLDALATRNGGEVFEGDF